MKKRGRPPKYIGIDKLIRKLQLSKKGLKLTDFNSFKEWYLKQNDCCVYCGLKQEQSIILYNKYPETTRGGKRGKSLELDRKNPIITDYGIIENLALSCYWCNNAKSNYFTFEEFKKIGKAIKIVQKFKIKK
ncbi:MAG TPA: hypothetical protein PLH25_07310 [Flavobacterium sp.]|jgi:hypothetical protein|nr:hypothetical protein [Flavobacterium sp.]